MASEIRCFLSAQHTSQMFQYVEEMHMKWRSLSYSFKHLQKASLVQALGAFRHCSRFDDGSHFENLSQQRSSRLCSSFNVAPKTWGTCWPCCGVRNAVGSLRSCASLTLTDGLKDGKRLAVKTNGRQIKGRGRGSEVGSHCNLTDSSTALAWADLRLKEAYSRHPAASPSCH